MSYSWDGFRIDASTLDEALDVVDAFRPVALHLRDLKNAAVVASIAATEIDNACVRGLPVDWCPLARTWDSVEKRRLAIVRTERHDPEVDLDFRLNLFRHPTGLHGIVTTTQRDWRDAWFALPQIHDMRWWNGTDRPNDVPQEEWDRRGERWRELIPSKTPALSSYEVILTPRWSRAPALAEILAALPSEEIRRHHVAKEIAIQRRMDEDEGSQTDSDKITRTIEAAIWSMSQEGSCAVDEIASKLVLPTIDATMLMEGTNDLDGQHSKL